MGHRSVQVTQRYAQLRPDLFRDSDLQLLDVDVTTPPTNVVELRPAGKEAADGCGLVADELCDEEVAGVNS